jgi:hypothetical protein
MGFAGGDGGLEGGAVHPGHHEDASGGLVLNDGGEEAVGIKFQFVVEAHIEREDKGWGAGQTIFILISKFSISGQPSHLMSCQD